MTQRQNSPDWMAFDVDAAAQHIAVSIAVDNLDGLPAFLTISVVDDGIGLAEDHPVGIGLHAMRERADELGGSCVIQRVQTGGTLVMAHLPITLNN